MTLMTASEDRDINDIFDDILFTEERLHKQSYREGYEEGLLQGEAEGYQLGYAQGQKIGAELGEIYGTVEGLLMSTSSGKIRKVLLQLKAAIDAFPKFNDPEADLVGDLENIRALNKRLKAMLHMKHEAEEEDSTSKRILNTSAKTNLKTNKDFSF